MVKGWEDVQLALAFDRIWDKGVQNNECASIKYLTHQGKIKVRLFLNKSAPFKVKPYNRMIIRLCQEWTTVSTP
jgi:hypothetical protein